MAASGAAWVIITGHSRGMGEAMAAQALAQGSSVLGISRKPGGASLAAAAQASGAALEEWQCDLADAEVAAERLSGWLSALAPDSVQSIALINNAALLSTPAPLHAVPRSELVAALRVGLEAPVLLTQSFLAGTQSWVSDASWSGDRRVLQISSGLGRSAMASVGSYCAIKAGLDHFSSSVALDQAELGPSGAKIVSLAPGIIATDMQVQLRSADGEVGPTVSVSFVCPSGFRMKVMILFATTGSGQPREEKLKKGRFRNAQGFPDQAKFVGFHETGALDSPAEAAEKVLGFLARPDFGSTVVADVRM